MGSNAELRAATEFITKHEIRPVVSMVIDGLENAEEGFQAMREHSQFGKIVVKLRQSDKSKM
jgi:NADPH:quinone reductase-like Zn-dependent oxidoreductase